MTEGAAAFGNGCFGYAESVTTDEIRTTAGGAIDWLERIAGDWRLLDSLPLHDVNACTARSPRCRRPIRPRIADAARLRGRTRYAARKRSWTRPAFARGDGGRSSPRRMCFRLPWNGLRPSDAAPSVDRVCYICKQPYSHLHHFYDQLCADCATVNFAARTELADLRGRVALLTGGRVKIGYQAGLKLLRSGARLIVTTRFPQNAASRYAQEADFGDWSNRLEIFGLDLRHLPSVEAFCRDLVATRAATGLHHQQRLPDGSPAAGILRAHDGRRADGRASTA